MLSFLFGCAKNAEIKDIETFSFRYSYGAMSNAYVVYTLTNEDGSYTATIKPKGAPEEEKLEFEVDESFAKELEAFLAENEVGRWNGFQKSNKTAADGKSFSLYITMADGSEVDARGYMKWPKNYNAVSAGITEIFEKLQ
ncbi:MAG: hypothetical protein IJC94_06520 [Oscillospiraceae bacterium]|nr:hypothetical protein [Oscillospiraceae bacterium]MBQ9939756.1 hypothetical protein [Oscillospiraceae bacterium]